MYIGIGSNIDAEQNLKRCADLLKEVWSDCNFSSVFQSKALEYKEQDDFLNAVALFKTDDTAEKVLEKLVEVEQKLEKAPPFRFGPRTIDLDLLLHGETILDDDKLILPHPRMHERRFVLEPLCELIGIEAEHPMLYESWQSLLEKFQDQDCTKTDITL